MAERLTPAQLRAAQRLLDRGLTLREIGERIGASFEAVCLGLFGGNPSAPLVGRGVAAVGGGGVNPPVASAAVTPMPPFPAVAEGSRATRAAEVGDGGEATAPGQRFRLVSEHGESLHENERVLTRMPKFFWRGEAGDVALLKARRPHWARLRAVEVLS